MLYNISLQSAMLQYLLVLIVKPVSSEIKYDKNNVSYNTKFKSTK